MPTSSPQPTGSTSPPNIGCIVGGSWGQYATARMLEFAADCGYENMDALNLANRHTNNEPITSDEYELLTDYSFKAEDWLNEHIAAPGHSFGWLDGEFYYLTKADWNGEI